MAVKEIKERKGIELKKAIKKSKHSYKKGVTYNRQGLKTLTIKAGGDITKPDELMNITVDFVSEPTIKQ